jgi:hypothetical protein
MTRVPDEVHRSAISRESAPEDKPRGREAIVFIAIAIHHAAPEHTEEFIDFMHKVRDVTTGASGLLEFKVCRAPDDSYLAGFSRWESPDTFRAALPAIRSLAPLRKPEWSTKPDELITLVEAER